MMTGDCRARILVSYVPVGTWSWAAGPGLTMWPWIRCSLLRDPSLDLEERTTNKEADVTKRADVINHRETPRSVTLHQPERGR